MTESDELQPSVVVIGAGALGCFLAARLHSAGCNVVLVPSAGRFRAVAGAGIRLSFHGLTRTIEVPCVRDASDLPYVDLAILATKAGAVESVAHTLVAFDSPRLGVLTVQNGVEAGAQVARVLSRSDVLSASVHGFFEMFEGGVQHVGVEPAITFGPVRPELGQAGKRFVAMFDRAGIACNYSADIGPVLWEKFMLAAAIGGVGAALGVPVGQIRAVEQGWDRLRSAMQEIADLAVTHGVRMADECVDRTLDFVASFPPMATSSLQRDLLAGRPSEFGSLTGAVPRLAHQTGLPVPVHDEIIAMIMARGLL